MTSSPPDPRHSDDSGRDWQAEFDAIVGHLDLDLSEPRRSAAREIVREPEPSSSAEHATRTSATDAEPATPHDDAHPTAADASAVPGFKPQWRATTSGLPIGDVPTDAAAAHDTGDVDEIDDSADFIPPEPAAFESDDPATVIMVVSLIVGPLWLMYLLFFHRYASAIWWGMAVGFTVLGFALAVTRQPKSVEERDPDDDGARV